MPMKFTIAGLTLSLFGLAAKGQIASVKKDTIQQSKTSMIAGTTGAQALNGGLEILRKGGNAMDGH